MYKRIQPVSEGILKMIETEILLKLSGTRGIPCGASGLGITAPPEIICGAPLAFRITPVGFEFPACAGGWTMIWNDRFDDSTAKMIASRVEYLPESGAIAVEVTETNTVESAAWIGMKPAAPIHAELTGFDAAGAVAFRLQILNWTYRNELGAGTPSPYPLSYVDHNPVMEFTVADSTWGRCVYLDETTPVLTLADYLHSAQSIKFRLESANAGFSGNVVLTPILGGVERDAVVCPTGEWSEISFSDLGSAGANGSFSLRRETADERDTLRDGSTITAIVTVLEVVYNAG